jgi:hypothetical protein
MAGLFRSLAFILIITEGIMGCKNRFFIVLLISTGTFLFAQEFGTFQEVNGTVETRSSGGDWVSASPGDRIEKSTLISSGFKSSAVISLGNSLIMIRPLTRLALEEILQNEAGEQVNLYLQTGRVRAEVSLPSGGKTDFSIRSPSAVASVRGTSFEFDTVNLRVNDGRVLYAIINGRQTYVAGGETSYVDELDRQVASPFEAAAENLIPSLPIGSNSGASPGYAISDTYGMGTIGINLGWD